MQAVYRDLTGCDGRIEATHGGLECGPEGFEFAVRPGELRITGRDRAGVFYGIQHLLPDRPVPVEVPGFSIIHLQSFC